MWRIWAKVSFCASQGGLINFEKRRRVSTTFLIIWSLLESKHLLNPLFMAMEIQICGNVEQNLFFFYRSLKWSLRLSSCSLRAIVTVWPLTPHFCAGLKVSLSTQRRRGTHFFFLSSEYCVSLKANIGHSCFAAMRCRVKSKDWETTAQRHQNPARVWWRDWACEWPKTEILMSELIKLYT